MNHELNDPLIDALLEEVMGGQSPPDLSARILAELDPITSGTHTGTISASDITQLSTAPRHSFRRRSLTVPVSMALSVTALILATIAIVVNTPRDADTENQFAERRGAAGNEGSTMTNPLLSNPDQPDHSPEDPSKPTPFLPPKPEIVSDDIPRSPQNPAQQASELIPPIPGHWQHPLAIASSSPTAAAVSIEKILTGIHHELDKRWKENGITPSETATHLEWIRRTYLRLIGRIPTKEELDRFNNVAVSDQQRLKLVDTLLYGDQYKAEFAQHWTTVWTNTLIGRQGGLDSDNASREGLQQYLRESLSTNKPYNEIVYELISAEGAATSGSEQFNGAVNFLLASLTNNDTMLATSRISSIFLGQKLQCAQCHHHPTSDIAQDHFWELDAYLSQLSTSKVDGDFTLTDTTNGGIQTSDGRTGVYYERPDGVARIAFPAFLGHTETNLSDAQNTSQRRKQLAHLTSESPLLARTLVNRLWNHFLGYGFTPSVDDMGPHLAVSHPQLLDLLSRQTESVKYDLKTVMKWIVLSDPFSRSSKYSASNDIDSPELGDQPLFSRYYSRQLEPEEVYQSLLVLTGKKRSLVTMGQQQQLAQRTWLGQFSQRMETDEGDESNSFDGDVHQSLVLMNGELMKQATSVTDATVLGKILKSKISISEKIDHLFLAAVARKPSSNEKNLITELIARPDSSPEQIFQDIWWALLNSNEFILDH